MILFSDLPDEISVYIDEFIQYQRCRNKFTHDVISWIKNPKYQPRIHNKILTRNNVYDIEYKKHFYLHTTDLIALISNDDNTYRKKITIKDLLIRKTPLMDLLGGVRLCFE